MRVGQDIKTCTHTETHEYHAYKYELIRAAEEKTECLCVVGGVYIKREEKQSDRQTERDRKTKREREKGREEGWMENRAHNLVSRVLWILRGKHR